MARKIGWWYAKKMLIIIVFLVSMITMSQAVQVHASGPVIDDQLHILTSAQKQQIYTENENLANKPFHQQIWFISTDATPTEIAPDGYALDTESLKESGFSLQNLQQAAEELHDNLLKKYACANVEANDYSGEQKYNRLDNRVNIIFVAPNFKYQVIPLLSDVGVQDDTTVRDFFLTHELNYTDTSQTNVMKTVNKIISFTNKHSANAHDHGGLGFSDVVFWILVGLIVLGIIIWLIHRHNYHGPKRTSFWDSDGDAKYDNGWLDGVYYGENSGDDSWKN